MVSRLAALAWMALKRVYFSGYFDKGSGAFHPNPKILCPHSTGRLKKIGTPVMAFLWGKSSISIHFIISSRNESCFRFDHESLMNSFRTAVVSVNLTVIRSL